MSSQIIKSSIKNHNQTQLNYFGQKIKKTMVPVDSYYVNRHADKMIELSGIKQTDKILEVGCGMGKFTFPLLKRGFKITGLDLSPFLLQKLLEHNNNLFNIDLICSDILEIPSEYDEQFDYVIGFFTLHHFLQLETYYQAMARVLKPGGKICFIEPNAYNPLYYVQIACTPGMSWAGDKGVAQMTHTKFKRAIDYAGLKNLHLDKYGFFPPFAVNNKFGQKTEQIIEKARIFNSISAFLSISVTK